MRFVVFLFFINSIAKAEVSASGNLAVAARHFNFSSTSLYSSDSLLLAGQLKLDYSHLNWKMHSDLEFQNDFNFKDSGRTTELELKSMFVEKSFRNFDAKIGVQTFILDGPDILNPADLVNAKNWTDPSQPKSLGSLALDISKEWGIWQLEVQYIPVQTTAVLPSEKSPWWPREKRLPIESEDTEIQIPNSIRYQFYAASELDFATQNNFALKLQRKTSELELGFLFYDGLAQDPFLLTQVSGTLVATVPKQVLSVQSPVILKPVYYRQRAVAGNFIAPFDSFSIKGGLNWLKPMGGDYRLPSESSTYVFGVEKNIEWPFGLTTLILQKEYQQKMSKGQVSFLRSIFENAISLAMRIPMGDDNTFLLVDIADQIGPSNLLRFSWEHRLSENFSSSIETQQLSGSSTSLLGLYDSYDSVQASVSYHF